MLPREQKVPDLALIPSKKSANGPKDNFLRTNFPA
jgi:hypothetical protein